MSKSFTFFESFAESARKMKDSDRLAFYDAIVACAIYGETMELPERADLVFTAIKPILEANVRDRENGTKGGRPKGKNPKENPLKNPLNNPPTKPIVMYSNVDVEYKKESNKEKKVASAPSVFVKPTIKEIDAYCKERRNNVDAEAFWNFYESKGWKVGGNPMKNWKAAIITWEKRHGDNKANSPALDERLFVSTDWSAENTKL